MRNKRNFLEKIYPYRRFKMKDELSTEYLIGMERMLRDYLINDTMYKEEIRKILSLPPEEFNDYVINYGLKDE